MCLDRLCDEISTAKQLCDWLPDAMTAWCDLTDARRTEVLLGALAWSLDRMLLLVISSAGQCRVDSQLND